MLVADKTEDCRGRPPAFIFARHPGLLDFFIRPSLPKEKKKAPAFHIAQEAVRPTVYFDTNRLRDPIMDDGCVEIKPTIDRSLATPHKLLTRRLADTNEAGLHCTFCSSVGAVGDAMMTSTFGE